MKAAQRQQIPCSYGRCAPSVACTAGMAEHGLALLQRPSDRTLSGSTGLGVHEPVRVRIELKRDVALGEFPAEFLQDMLLFSHLPTRRRARGSAVIYFSSRRGR